MYAQRFFGGIHEIQPTVLVVFDQLLDLVFRTPIVKGMNRGVAVPGCGRHPAGPLLVPGRRVVQRMLVQGQRYRHAGSCGGGIDGHFSPGQDYGRSHEAQSRAGVPASHGCGHVEAAAVIGHFELYAVVHVLGDAAQPECHS